MYIYVCLYIFQTHNGSSHDDLHRQASSSIVSSSVTVPSVRTPSTVSVIHTPLPDLPQDQTQTDLPYDINHPYELIPPTFYNAPGEKIA